MSERLEDREITEETMTKELREKLNTFDCSIGDGIIGNQIPFLVVAIHILERIAELEAKRDRLEWLEKRFGEALDRFPARLETENGEEPLDVWAERVEDWYTKLCQKVMIDGS
jgi:hypothetical protein